jgi:predicted phosphodiesterase
MRVAAIYDIHGNLPALEAVLAEIRREGVDRIVVGGDVVCGPMTAAVMDRLLDLRPPADFICGNAEASVLTEMAGNEHRVPFPEPVRDVLRWEAAQLRRFAPVFGNWPMTLRHSLPALGDVLFCHATPRDLEEIFLESTPEHVLLPIFEPVRAGVVVCGHTHMQFDRNVGQVRVVNAGSVGMPFGDRGAHWLLLGPDVDLRYTRYDFDAAADRVRDSDYPLAHEFADHNILQPPSEEEMLTAFDRISL